MHLDAQSIVDQVTMLLQEESRPDQYVAITSMIGTFITTSMNLTNLGENVDLGQIPANSTKLGDNADLVRKVDLDEFHQI